MCIINYEELIKDIFIVSTSLISFKIVWVYKLTSLCIREIS